MREVVAIDRKRMTILIDGRHDPCALAERGGASANAAEQLEHARR